MHPLSGTMEQRRGKNLHDGSSSAVQDLAETDDEECGLGDVDTNLPSLQLEDEAVEKR